MTGSGAAGSSYPAGSGLDPAGTDRIRSYLQRLVDDGVLPGCSLLISRGDTEVAAIHVGVASLGGADADESTLYRIASMTKPIVTVAALQLVERGRMNLFDPLSRYLPAFAQSRVYVDGSAAAPVTRASLGPIRLEHLLSHTAGLTMAFWGTSPVDQIYRDLGFGWRNPPDWDLAACCEAWASAPLLYEPGTRWQYSVASEVLGHVIEHVSGQALPDYIAEHVTGPLGMDDTGFVAIDPERLATAYSASPTGLVPAPDEMSALGVEVQAAPSGGGGLVSTPRDYLRFADALRAGGARDGTRLLSPRTTAMMTRNYLPEGADLARFGWGLLDGEDWRGVGFGWGLAVNLAHRTAVRGVGEFGWSGAFGTDFWVDPGNDVSVVFMTQVLGLVGRGIRSTLRTMVSAAWA